MDPRDLLGVQPSPFDIRYKLNPGKTLKLRGGEGGDGVQNQSEYITEWVVKLLAPPETIADVVAGEGFGFRVEVLANYNGDQFTEYQATASPGPLEIPLVGLALGVHGRLINCRIIRVAPGATKELQLQAAIIPGRPSLSWVNRTITVPPAGVAAVQVPTFATRFQCFGTVQAGDVISQLGAGGVVQVVTLLAGQTGLFPLHNQAISIQYGSAAGKEIVVGFEVNS